MNVSGQTDDEVMCNGIHQVPKTGVAIKDVIQGGWLHSQILQQKREKTELLMTSAAEDKTKSNSNLLLYFSQYDTFYILILFYILDLSHYILLYRNCV